MTIPTKTKLNRIDQILRELPGAVYLSVSDLSAEAWITAEPVSFEDRQSGKRAEFKPGETWGELWNCAWFHLSGQVPSTATGADVVLLIDFNGEGLVVDEAGKPIQGLTSISSTFDFSLGKPGKRVLPIANPATGSEVIDLWIEVGLNDLFGSLKNGGKLEEARIAIRREEALGLFYDFEVMRELLDQLPDRSARYASVLQALYEASILLAAAKTDDTILAARNRLAPELAKRGGDPSLTISAIGHAHIDLAWLWPIRETIRKGARTFSTVLRMMERYPDYVFGASQPQLYQWMKDRYPSLYSEIGNRIAEGRWEAQGAMWVEPDANIPSGESLVRQLLYGKRFFRSEFNKETSNLWMPDVFGYSGSIPQILRKAGVETFLTQKLSWSTFNQHPHHTFHWEGIDGSRVLVHMPPEATYNSSATPRAITRAENDYRDKEVSDRCLLLFGIGDGGGGPGEEHLERLAREKNLAGLAPVVQESSQVFFDRLAEKSEQYAVWRGELYLERHQGTLTSQARNKRFNRKLEFALRELELASVRGMMSGLPFPSERLDAIWKEVLLYQFHDILPGSSITRVFDESLARYKILLAEVNELLKTADTHLLGVGDRTAAVNSLAWTRSEWLKTDGDWYWIAISGLSCLPLLQPSVEFQTVSATKNSIENEWIKITFATNGEIVSIFYKGEQGRELLRPGQAANRLSVYEDQGDAWDFPVDYDSVPPACFELVSSEPISDGPQAIMRQTRRLGASTIVQDVILTASSRRIDFRTQVDWNERHKMLRTAFPVDIDCDKATCEIQFGFIERPTHGNTSWDWAKAEVCAHKWIDVSEASFGVALLNDCKYGHRVSGGTLDINLLRSPTSPDPQADQGKHEFTYALYPHEGNDKNEITREAYNLNAPLRVVRMVSDSDVPPLLSMGVTSLIVDTVKKAEDSEEIIIRMYESKGSSERTTVKFGFAVANVAIVNLMEEEPVELVVVDNSISVTAKPFEIITLKVTAKY